MLESLLSNPNGQVAWNGVLPLADSNTLFRLGGFNTTADIKDTGGKNIPFSNYGLVAGSDSFGTYMNFNGSSWLEFKNSLVNAAAVEITFIIGGVVKNPNPYPPPLLDTRPTETNGYYFIFPIWSHDSSMLLQTAYPGAETKVSTEPVKANPVVIKYVINNRTIKVYCGGKLLITFNWMDNGASGAFVDQYVKVGRSAFASAGVPNFQGKMYYFEIKKIP